MSTSDSVLRVPRSTAEITLTIKGSRFIARAQAAADVAAANAAIDSVRAKHPTATHVVYAFRVGGNTSEEYGMSDAGEPKGTAGRPTLEVLRGSGVVDVALTTVRYFGGTKLGTGGLVRAYTEAAQAVLAELPTRTLVTRVTVRVKVGYEHLDALQRLLKAYGAEVLEQDYAEDASLCFRVEEARFPELQQRARDVSRGTIDLIPTP